MVLHTSCIPTHPSTEECPVGPRMVARKLKNPTGPISIRRFINGMYLMLFFSDHQTFPDGYGFERRDPYWLTAGWEASDGKTIVWSQPEVALYALTPCEDSRCVCADVRYILSSEAMPCTGGVGYPDFIEDQGQIFVSETDKSKSRIHRLQDEMLNMMHNQRSLNEISTRGISLEYKSASNCIACSEPGAQFCAGCGTDSCCGPTNVTAPPLGNLSQSASFAIELVIDTRMATQGMHGKHPRFPAPSCAVSAEPLFDCREDGSKGASGVAILYTSNAGGSSLNISLVDKQGHSQSWDVDHGAVLWSTAQRHHVVFIVDGLSRVISTVADGILSDGGWHRSQGFTHIGASNFEDVEHGYQPIGDVNGASTCVVHPSVSLVRVYDRYLLTSEAIGNWRAWKAGAIE